MPWHVVLFALHSLLWHLHYSHRRTVMKSHCQLHGHRHPLVTVPTELALPSPPRGAAFAHGDHWVSSNSSADEST